ncbi:hypothetical protein FB566_2892 [Stackebrandtia endophytica]|uniref:Uncharacterized protein n=1 Tax=Stackebrandtia endophytica TaxID=1496996 RepID=A0A543AXQ7_9ACTN|nr:hypothetical protein FB566_2892 [Stackebrandtia endophytica]
MIKLATSNNATPAATGRGNGVCGAGCATQPN